MIFKNIIPIQVRFNDVDMMGHVSNTVYLNYYDAGKVNYFDIVMPDMDFINYGFVGANITIEYLKPIYMKTKILVKTRVSVLGNKSMTMEHILVDELSNETLSTCSAVLVCYAIKETRSILIPERWRNNILEYDENVILK
jgi:acyl-CoA thioester hydrolase